MKKTALTWLCVAFAFLGVFLAWRCFWSWSATVYPALPERGTWGDSFGALNALFSGLAFAALIIALLMQGKELQLQRQELSRTTAAQQGSQAALEKQQEYLARSADAQAFVALAQLSDADMTRVAVARAVLEGKFSASDGALATDDAEMERYAADVRAQRAALLSGLFIKLGADPRLVFDSAR